MNPCEFSAYRAAPVFWIRALERFLARVEKTVLRDDERVGHWRW